MKLEAFLYLLMRDYITSGKLEKILTEVENISKYNAPLYSSIHLGAYAKELATELLKEPKVNDAVVSQRTNNCYLFSLFGVL